MKRLLQHAQKAAILSVLTNTILALVKGFAGIVGHSDALIADAIESCADIFSSFLVLIGIRYANKPADEDHPYGHGKAEPLVTFAVVGLVARKGDTATELSDFKGLGKQQPALALALTVFLLAQAGVPLTSGFVAKFGVIKAAVEVHSYAIAIAAM